MQIPFHKTHTTDEELNAAIEAIRSGWLTMGPKTVEFENQFKEYIGSNEAKSGRFNVKDMLKGESIERTLDEL